MDAMTTRRTTPLMATATAVLALALSGCGEGDADESTGTGSPAAEQSTSAAPLTLSVPEEAAGRCQMPNAQTLSGFDSAFEGTVTVLADGTATIEVDRWFTGDEQPDTVVVDSPSREMQALLSAVPFEEGKTYLVSSTDGRVTLCGFTGESTAELEELYEQAFTG